MKLIKLLIILVLLFVSSFSCCYFRGNPINGGMSGKPYHYGQYTFKELDKTFRDLLYSNQYYITPVKELFLYNNEKKSLYRNLLGKYSEQDLINDKKLMINAFEDGSNMSNQYFIYLDDTILNVLVGIYGEVNLIGIARKNEKGYFKNESLKCNLEYKYAPIFEREIITKLDSLLKLRYPNR
jgi:hypothetical protein